MEAEPQSPLPDRKGRLRWAPSATSWSWLAYTQTYPPSRFTKAIDIIRLALDTAWRIVKFVKIIEQPGRYMKG